MVRSVGVNVDALPLLDVRQKGASDIIGDRALGTEPMQVAALGRAVLDGLASAGVVGIVKHIPGHGRALVDSHHELPIVTASAEDLEIDLEPFERLASAPMGMMAHVVYTAWDPDHPSSQSPFVIEDIVRERIGFDGFLMSDDSNMNALTGTQPERAAACVEAGCDVALPCNGVLADNIAIAERLAEISAGGGGAAGTGDGGNSPRYRWPRFRRGNCQARPAARASLVIHDISWLRLRRTTSSGVFQRRG